MQDLRIYNLIHKRLTGDISASEMLELESLEKQNDYSQLIADTEAVWVGSKEYFPQKSFDVEAAKLKFKQNLASTDTPSSIPTQKLSSNQDSSNGWLIGLIAAVILAGLSYLAYNHFSGPDVIVGTDELEYATLDDNSQIWLKSASTLEIFDFDGADTREVKLSGEAFFKVSPNAEKPFHIDLDNGNRIEVLGTAFNVISDLGDGTTKVDVKEGSVKLYSITNPELNMILTAGESSTLNSKTNTKEKKKTPTIYSFLGNALSFNGSPLDEVFTEISTNYNVNFDYDNTQVDLSCEFTSPLIDKSELPEIIDLLNEFYPNLKIEQNESALTEYLVSGSCR